VLSLTRSTPHGGAEKAGLSRTLNPLAGRGRSDSERPGDCGAGRRSTRHSAPVQRRYTLKLLLTLSAADPRSCALVAPLVESRRVHLDMPGFVGDETRVLSLWIDLLDRHAHELVSGGAQSRVDHRAERKPPL
jgi:hypothetical protein